MIVSSEAIVLHSRRFGDSSRIVTLYSAELGKVTVVAKGARTMKSSFGAALEPFPMCDARSITDGTRSSIRFRQQRRLGPESG
ncbi:MAG: DNA repair protein RecO [Ignavibacteria bacterium]|nr:DNA repair protein RecO [Ignavibacteria bacterium]